MSGKAPLAAPIAVLLPLAALADDIVPNSIDCAAFARLPDGSWSGHRAISFLGLKVFCREPH